MTAAAVPSEAGKSQGPFSPMVVGALVLVGIFAFAALVVLSAFAPELQSGNDGGSHALSRSAVGYGGIVQLLRDSGQPVLVSRGRIPALHKEGLLILTPGQATDPALMKKFGFGGPVLIVLPKWWVGPAPRARGWVVQGPLIDAGDLAGKFLTPFGEGAAVSRQAGTRSAVLTGYQGPFEGREVALGPVQNLQTVQGAGWEPMLVDEGGRAVLLHKQDTQYWLLSDPDLINTHGIKDLIAAQAAVEVLTTLKAGEAPILFDVSLQGFKRERSLMRLILAPPYLGMTLILTFAAFLMGLHALARFGPPRRGGRVLAFGKQALADNTAGLVRMAGREPRMAGPYAALIRANVARGLAAPRDMDDAQLDLFLDRMGRKAGTTQPWADLINRADKARNVSELIAVAQDLYRWKREMTREP